MKIIIPILVVLFLAGCGPAVFDRESYDAEPYNAYKSGDITVWVSISAQREITSFMPFYYSDKQTEPYTLDVIVHSVTQNGKEVTVLSAIVEIPNREKIQLVKTPISNKLDKKEWNTYADLRTQIPFGKHLQYQDDLEFKVNIEFLLPNSKEKHQMSIKFHSVKTHGKGTTFDVIMSV